MLRYTIFLILISPLLLTGQTTEIERQRQRVEARQQQQDSRIDQSRQQQQDRIWREVNGGREQAEPDRSVATAPFVRIPDPGYSNMEDNPTTTARTNAVRIETEFLGERIPVRGEWLPELQLSRDISERNIARAYQTLNRMPIPVLLSDLKRTANERHLNDWGYLQWVHTVTGEIYPNDAAARNLATSWIMQQSGYRSTVSYDGRRVNLLVQTQQKLYGHSYLNVSGIRMYVVNPLGSIPDVRSAHLFEPRAARSGRALDMRIRQAPNLPGRTRVRNLSFKYGTQRYTGSIEVNRRVAQFYYYYPLVDWSVYIAAPISKEAIQSLATFLRRPLSEVRPRRGWTMEMEQANLLLHFVQSAFPYRADGEAIGEEHYSFAEEMLALPYSDCEDRSALYATLVRELLDLEAVGLLFPGHAAVGVNFGRSAPGASVQVEGTKYLVCDPSYIGADIGMALPQVRGSRLTIVGR